MNICDLFYQHVQRIPHHTALSVAAQKGKSEQLTYQQLLEHACGLQQQLLRAGFKTGDRLLVLMPPGLTFYALIIAMFGLGLTPVLLERGMTRNRIRASIRQSQANGLIAIPEISRYWWLFPELWHIKRFTLDSKVWGTRYFNSQAISPSSAFICHDLPANTTGMVTFTSGSTALPKGADRTHASLLAQHLALKRVLPENSDDVDLSCFPVFILHNLCCGISSVLPDIDFRQPGNVEPSRIISQIRHHGVTRLSGAPAYLQRLVHYAQQQAIQFPHMRNVMTGGATVTHQLLMECLAVFPHAQNGVLYGSTESEPIAYITMTELLQDWDLHPGYLVGYPVPEADVCIADPATLFAGKSVVPLPKGEIGEILVAGDHVLQAYINNPVATAENKLPRTAGTIWHRTGDTGCFDSQGRLWLYGRTKDTIHLPSGEQLHPFMLEKQLDHLSGIIRSACINHPRGEVCIIIEGKPNQPEQLKQILSAQQFPLTTPVYIIGKMIVDGRHNSKLDRPSLKTLLAKKQLKRLTH